MTKTICTSLSLQSKKFDRILQLLQLFDRVIDKIIVPADCVENIYQSYKSQDVNEFVLGT